MTGLRAWLESFVEATVDVGLSVVGLLLVLTPTAGVVNTFLGEPIPENEFGVVLLVVAVVVAYPFVNRWLSLGWLGTYVLAFWGGMIVVGFVGGWIVLALGVELPGSTDLWDAVLITQGHAVAITISYLDDVPLVPEAVVDRDPQ